MKNPKDERLVALAARMAEDSAAFADAKIIALLVYKNQIIATGFNTSKKHPITLKYQKNEECIYPHAELMAIVNAAKRLSTKELRKSTLYVARVKKPHRHADYVWGLSKPCVGCMRAIKAFGIRRVVYTTDTHLQFEELE